MHAYVRTYVRMSLHGLVVEGGGEKDEMKGNKIGIKGMVGMFGREVIAGRGGRPKFGTVG